MTDKTPDEKMLARGEIPAHLAAPAPSADERAAFEAWTAQNYRLGQRQSPWDVAEEAWLARARLAQEEVAALKARLLELDDDDWLIELRSLDRALTAMTEERDAMKEQMVYAALAAKGRA